MNKMRISDTSAHLLKCISLLFLLLKGYFGVAQESASYSDNLSMHLSDIAGDRGEGEEEGDLTHARREFVTWAPRIYPDDDFSNAYEANSEYVHSFNNDRDDSACGPHTDAHWTQLGPVGNMTNTPTVGQIHRITFHPSYDGARNRYVYCTSGFGGLWQSDDGGA